MRITIITPAVIDPAKLSQYNSQSLGLARALVELGHSVTIMLATRKRSAKTQTVGSVVMHFSSGPSVGSHGWVSHRALRSSKPDLVLVNTDLQLIVPSILRWSAELGVGVACISGTMSSNSKLPRVIKTFLAHRNATAMRQILTFAKTPPVANQLRVLGCSRVKLIPVGLDTSDIPAPSSALRSEARSNLGINPTDKVLSFVGRIEADRRPLDLAPIFAALCKTDDWQLLVAGSGALESAVHSQFTRANLDGRVRFLGTIPNKSIWTVHAAADVMVNLCQVEIFGMAILESMYYGTPVVAVHADGPDHVIRDRVDGRLCAAFPDVIADAIQDVVANREQYSVNSQERVQTSFSWAAIARELLQTIEVEGVIRGT